MEKLNRSKIYKLNGITIVEWDGTSFKKDYFVEHELQIYKSLRETTENQFIPSEWVPINSGNAEIGTPLVMGLWNALPNQYPDLLVQQFLEYRFDDSPNSEMVYLRGQFSLPSTISGTTSVIIGTLPIGVRPSYSLKSTSYTNTDSIEFDLEIKTNGDIVITKPVIGFLPTTIAGEVNVSPYSIGDIFFRPEPIVTPINTELEIPPIVLPPPVITDLNMIFIKGTDNSSFPIQRARLTLGEPLSERVVITNLGIDGFTSVDCFNWSGVVSSNVSSSNFIWEIGESGQRENTIDGGTTSNWFNTSSYSFFGIRINGTDYELSQDRIVPVGNDFIKIKFFGCIPF